MYPDDFNDNTFDSQPTFDAAYSETEPVSEAAAEAAEQEVPQCDPPVYAVPSTKQKKHREKKQGGLGAKIVALALCCSLVGGALGAGGMALLSGNSGTPSASDSQEASNVLEGKREAQAVNVAKVDTSKQMTPSEVYAANVNSTVGITTSVSTTNFWGYQTTAAASGSGFIISDDGYILTNFHVIEGANSVTVTMYDGTTYEATLVGYDESNDLAVLKADATGLVPVVLGDSDQLQVGEAVLAIGNPLGELTFSLTAGTVSALDRKITMSNGLSMELIQTDCAINSGNSGGALFNLYGEVIGITNAKYSGSGNGTASIDNIGFAIPINSVRDIAQSLIENGYISKPYIGVSVEDVSEEAQSYGLPVGAAVRVVTENGPAAKAGLQVNDIITAVNGKEIASSDELVKTVSKVSVGDTLKLTVYRQNETRELSVIVEEKIQSALGDEDNTQQSDRQQEGQNSQQPQQSDPFGGMDPFSFFGY